MSDRDYVKEFDEHVNDYISYMDSLEDPKIMRKKSIESFLEGMASVFEGVASLFNPENIFGTSSKIKKSFRQNSYSNKLNFGHPLYSRQDLTPQQKNAIAMAAVWKKTERDLEEKVADSSKHSGLPSSANKDTPEKHLIKQIYNDYRNIYVHEAMKF